MFFLLNAGAPVYSAAADKKPVPTAEELSRTLDPQSNKFVKDINILVNVVSAGVGIIVVTVMIIGGIQYSMAGDNAQAIQAARQRIYNGLIALAVFLLTWSFLQWLIPGGVLK